MEAPEIFRERFAESGWRVVEHAFEATRRREQNYVSLEHLIAALAAVESDLFDVVMLDLSVDAREMRALLKRRIGVGLEHKGAGLRIAPEVNNYFRRAWKRASTNTRKIDGGDLLIALAEDKRGLFVEMLRSLNAVVDDIAWAVYRRVAEAEYARTHDLETLRARFVKAKPKSELAAGDTVRIKSGPFASFTCKVEDVFKESASLRGVVQIFGRATPIVLSWLDVEKITFNEQH